jgi:AcrR family transcriptional regulator
MSDKGSKYYAHSHDVRYFAHLTTSFPMLCFDYRTVFDIRTSINMSAKDRRERVKQATRQGILDGARRIGRDEGWTALTIRKVAEHVEYSPSMIYQYFESKEDILHTVLREGFGELARRMERAQRSADDPWQQVERVGDAYWQFAHEDIALYQLMHGTAGVHTDAAVRADAVRDVCGIAESTLVAWAAANEVRLDDPLASAEIVWSLLHGWVSLTIGAQVYGDETRAKRLLHDAVRALLLGWKSTAARI